MVGRLRKLRSLTSRWSKHGDSNDRTHYQQRRASRIVTSKHQTRPSNLEDPDAARRTRLQGSVGVIEPGTVAAP